MAISKEEAGKLYSTLRPESKAPTERLPELSAGELLAPGVSQLFRGEGIHSAIQGLLKHPVINASVAAGQTLGQSLDSLVNVLTGAHLRAPKVAEPGAISTKIGEALGYAPLFEAGGEAVAGARALPYVGRAAQEIARFVREIPGVGRVATALAPKVAGAAIGGALAAPERPIKGAEEMAVAAPIADIGALGAQRTLKAIAPYVSSPILTAKRIGQKAIRGFLKKEAYPFIKQRFDTILNDIRGTSSKEASNEDIYNNIKQHYEELHGDSAERSLRGERNSFINPGSSVGDAYAALPLDLPVNKKEFTKVIDANINNLQKRAVQLAETVKAKKPYLDAIEDLKDLKRIKLGDLGDAKGIKEFINQQLRDQTTPDLLKGPLRDIKDVGIRKAQEAELPGTQEGKAQLRAADERYKNEIVPFIKMPGDKKSPFWKRYTTIGDKKLSGLVSEYVKPGIQKDQADLVSNLIRITPPDNGNTRRLIAYDYLKDVEDNPRDILKKWNKLGPKQKALLLPEYQEELDQLHDLSRTHSAAFEKPKGKGPIADYLHLAATLGPGAALLHYGHPDLAITSFIAPYLLSKTAQKVLTNPGAQDLFIKNLEQEGLVSREDIPEIQDHLRNVFLSAYREKSEKTEKPTSKKQISAAEARRLLATTGGST